MKLMVNNIFSTTEELIMAVLAAISALSTLLCFIQYLRSKRNFQETCNSFMNRFNKLPSQVLLYRDGGFFFSFMRDSFFIIALLARENGFYTRDMSKEEVRFIKSLPEEQTKWIKTKVISTIISFVAYVAAFIFYLIAIKN
ncbi:hypothetical protein I6H07_02445 [Hafnia alvei]|uniref:hypothetical protein n=1 Tax=Hafnia alvei TaxID=569 RepID=UPI000FDA656B|nr:hypothetical protein [Hafnia alvei]MBI0274703.1 hypothetical protein [Hafnia alvei]